MELNIIDYINSKEVFINFLINLFIKSFFLIKGLDLYDKSKFPFSWKKVGGCILIAVALLWFKNA